MKIPRIFKPIGISIAILLFVRIPTLFPSAIEHYYSQGIYPYISRLGRVLFGIFPFSVGDILYTLLLVGFLYNLVQLIRRKIKLQKLFLRIWMVICTLYVWFYVSWGYNYYRAPLSQRLEIDTQYTSAELIDYTQTLIDEINVIYNTIQSNDSTAVEIPSQYSERIFEISGQNPSLFVLKSASIKNSLYSTFLSYMGYSGYFNPFTHEAQINSLMPNVKKPFVSCHERAHQMGIAFEDEANFIGFIDCINNTNIYFKYSGYLVALQYCLHEVRLTQPKEYQRLRNQICQGIFENYKQASSFWKQYKNPLEPVFKKTYDTYLKAHSQSEGIKSYSHIVDLLINYHFKSSSRYNRQNEMYTNSKRNVHF